MAIIVIRNNCNRKIKISIVITILVIVLILIPTITIPILYDRVQKHSCLIVNSYIVKTLCEKYTYDINSDTKNNQGLIFCYNSYVDCVYKTYNNVRCNQYSISAGDPEALQFQLNTSYPIMQSSITMFSKKQQSTENENNDSVIELITRSNSNYCNISNPFQNVMYILLSLSIICISTIVIVHCILICAEKDRILDEQQEEQIRQQQCKSKKLQIRKNINSFDAIQNEQQQNNKEEDQKIHEYI